MPHRFCCRCSSRVGLGLDAVETGSLILVYFLGNLLMKSVTTPALRYLGFRTVLVVNGLVAALTIGAFAFVDGETPRLLLFALLIACGLSRSMQFTALTMIAFADVTPAQRSAAATISAMLQQLAQLLGVAVAAAVMRLSPYFAPPAADGGMLIDIRAAFLCRGHRLCLRVAFFRASGRCRRGGFRTSA